MIVHQPLQCIIDFVLSNRESPAVAVFLATLPNLKLFYLPTTLSIICVCLKMSISLSISHAASMFWIKIGFLSTSLESHKTSVFFYVVYVTINSPKTISPPKHLQISDGLRLFQKNSKV